MSNKYFMYNSNSNANSINMKKFILYFLSIFAIFNICAVTKPIFVTQFLAQENDIQTPEVDSGAPKTSLLAIVIDDFGGYSRAGVDELLDSSIPITCAILPFSDNSQSDYDKAISNGKEVILHMPMQAHISLPENWYGSMYIKNNDTPQTAIDKLEKCLNSMPQVKGFNIHIGSGVSQNVELMQSIYDYAKEHNLFFLDSRTILADKCEEAAMLSDSIYIGRDIFLEPEHNRSYAGVINRLNECAQIAQEKGYAIAIGHVGPEGGLNTARAILDWSKKCEENKIKIVPLSEICQLISQEQFK